MIYNLNSKRYYTGNNRSTRVYKMLEPAEKRMDMLSKNYINKYEMHTFGRVS
jgi:hypothetical protein